MKNKKPLAVPFSEKNKMIGKKIVFIFSPFSHARSTNNKVIAGTAMNVKKANKMCT
jgi:hypothetical protein